MNDFEKAEWITGDGKSSVIVDWTVATPGQPIHLVLSYLRAIPGSREVSLAITKLEEALHWLEAADRW